MEQIKINRIEVRSLQLSDYVQLKESMQQAYGSWETPWNKTEIRSLIERFPEGQIAVVADDVVVGCALSIILPNDRLEEEHTYQEITGNFTFSTHTPKGDVLYGIEVFIHRDYRGLRLGRRLYDARKELCENLNLRSIVFGGRLPGYKEHAEELSPKEYIQKVRQRELYDPVLSFQLANDFHVVRVLKGYLPGDPESMEFATLLEWNNIYFRQEKGFINRPKSSVRLGLVQWLMRPVRDLEDISEQIEFYVDAISGYHCDFLVFPELFNAALMARFNHLPEAEAIKQLAQFTEPLLQRMAQFAISYNINIITGSMPLLREGRLFNVGYLCHRSGHIDSYEKIHIAHDQAQAWGMEGGRKVRTFDTDCGQIGVLISYDVEFPELGRLLAKQGMQILFVPFHTSTQTGYTRVRCCAQARAIENECFVAIAGSVGNLPKVENMDIQFAQSAVFTPADFAFPLSGIKGEATPNTETALIVEVDTDLLKELHTFGAVRNLLDRREDIYTLEFASGSQSPAEGGEEGQ